jgi:hypothetical protein
MNQLLDTLYTRNETLFLFGLACLVLAVVCLLLTRFTNTQVMGVNAWYKPFKFALSTTLYVWAMAWFCYYLMPALSLRLFNWTVVGLLGFEIVYIALQAGRGQLSHFNQSSPVYATLYSLMGLAATVVTLFTAYIGILFFIQSFPDLPDYYVWSIRIGIILFVIFSLEGAVMGARMSHTIGGADGGTGLPIVNWSTRFGDPRIAHFIGMHALQVLPILSWYVLKDLRLTLLFGLLYTALAVFTLVQALNGKPLFAQNRLGTTEPARL